MQMCRCANSLNWSCQRIRTSAHSHIRTLKPYLCFTNKKMPKETRPNYIWSMLTTKCPRCRRGPMFSNSNPWNLKETLKMPEKCSECGQIFELEVGFWYGTGYVSYALTVVMSGLSLIFWWLLIGLSSEDNRFFWWLGTNSALLIFLQPWLMRF